MKKVCTFLFLYSTLFFGCNNNQTANSSQQDNIMTKKIVDIQGHRGCRGHYPENSILGFKKAMDMGVHTLEMDVVITKDKHVLVSHEPWMSHELVQIIVPAQMENPSKLLQFRKKDELYHNIFDMTLQDVKKFYQFGMLEHPRFPNQEKVAVKKPTLAEVIDATKEYAIELGIPPVRYNIEIKRKPEGDNIYHPPAEEFTKRVLDLLDDKDVAMLSTVQSFDLECLQVAHRLEPMQTLALLIEDWTFSLEKNLDSLGFVPPILSPYYVLVNEELMQQAKANNMKVVPWTANEEEDIQRLLDLGVAGIISDYPDRVVKLSGLRNE